METAIMKMNEEIEKLRLERDEQNQSERTGEKLRQLFEERLPDFM